MNRREFIGAGSSLGMALVMPPFAVLKASDLPSEITAMGASQLSAAIRQRLVSCRDVMQAYLARIDRYNATYNAIVSRVDADELLVQADIADQELEQGEVLGWMHGMPHAVKDLANVRGLPTSFGSPLFAGTIA
ncbi:MAG TPA: amidase family protein, partial [Woeseiaceae bacterium]|nr:amidase family protein [Woeseiaceae bacterium]